MSASANLWVLWDTGSPLWPARPWGLVATLGAVVPGTSVTPRAVIQFDADDPSYSGVEAFPSVVRGGSASFSCSGSRSLLGSESHTSSTFRWCGSETRVYSFDGQGVVSEIPCNTTPTTYHMTQGSRSR